MRLTFVTIFCLISWIVFDKEKFMTNPMDFWCVATDAATGEPVYHQLHDAGYVDLEWIRASSSIPFFAHPVAIQGQLLL